MILEIQSESASHTRPIAKRCKRVEDSDSEGSKEEVEMAKPANLKMLHFFAKKQPASPTQKRVVRREAKQTQKAVPKNLLGSVKILT